MPGLWTVWAGRYKTQTERRGRACCGFSVVVTVVVLKNKLKKNE